MGRVVRLRVRPFKFQNVTPAFKGDPPFRRVYERGWDKESTDGWPIRRKQVNSLGTQACSQVLSLYADNGNPAPVRELIAVTLHRSTRQHATYR